MRGLSFKIPRPKGHPLRQILKYTQTEKFYWYVIDCQNDTWDSGMNNLLFDAPVYEGSAFGKVIEREHFVIFLKLQAYVSHADYAEILSYEEFKKSDCQILLLIHDCCFVDIYMKDQTMLEETYQYAIAAGFQNVHYLSDGNESREILRVI